MIPKEIKNFMETSRGREVFIRAAACKTYQQYYDRQKSFLNPPETVVRWFKILHKLTDALKKE